MPEAKPALKPKHFSNHNYAQRLPTTQQQAMKTLLNPPVARCARLPMRSLSPHSSTFQSKSSRAANDSNRSLFNNRRHSRDFPQPVSLIKPPTKHQIQINEENDRLRRYKVEQKQQLLLQRQKLEAKMRGHKKQQVFRNCDSADFFDQMKKQG